jgi:hypothetical protein
MPPEIAELEQKVDKLEKQLAQVRHKVTVARARPSRRRR